jgi:hypothetical protein
MAMVALGCYGCAPKPASTLIAPNEPNAAPTPAAARASNAASQKGLAQPPSWEAPNHVLQLVARDQVVFARTLAQRIYRWDTTTGKIRMLPQDYILAMAPDASDAARTTKTDANRIDIIELETGRLKATRSFDNRVRSVQAMAEKWAWVSLWLPSIPLMPATSIVLPDSQSGLWRFDSDQAPIFGSGFQLPSNVIVARRGHWLGYTISSRIHLVMLGEPGRSVSVALAPEWRPPRKPEASAITDYPHKPSPQIEDWVYPISMAPIGESGEVMLGYSRLHEPRECRLERWTPDFTSEARGTFVRLATERGRCSINVLAISDDGAICVTTEMATPIALRRAPRYEAEPLTSEAATSVVFLAGGTRVVTGHQDGRMQLWDVQTRALLAEVP